MLLKWLSVVVFFIGFIFILHHFEIKAEAQSCGGSWGCRLWETNCQTPSGGVCFTHNPPSCVCQEFCPATITTIPGFCSGLSQAQCGNITWGNPACCSATDVSNGCFWNEPPACGAHNCFNRACTDGSGNSCQCYGVCSGSSCVTGGVIPGSCSAPPPTPTPTLTCTPGAYCNDFCVGCGVSQNYVYDNNCNCTVASSTYSQPLCNTCGSWCPSHSSCGGGGPTPSPTTAPCTRTLGQTCGFGFCCAQGACMGGTCQNTSNPTPTPDTGGCPPGSHVDSSLCGGCCADGTTCTAVGGFPGHACVADDTGGPGGCPVGQMPVSQCSSNACEFAGCGWFSTCSTNIDCTCGNLSCDAGENYSNCPSDCSYDISGKVFVDANGDGDQDCSFTCNNGAGDELNYNGATVRLTPGGTTDVTSGLGSSGGSYSFDNQAPGAKTLTLTVPAGYTTTTSNPISFTLSSNTTRNFGIRQAAPACVPGSITMNPSGGSVDPGDSVTLSVTSCTNVENPDNGNPPPPFDWDPDTGGNNPPPIIDGQTDTPTSSTTTWTAPACPTEDTTYTPQVTVGGAGGTTSYNTSINVPGTVSVTAHVRTVTSVGSCTTTSGNPYNNGGTGANLNLNNGGGGFNQNQTTNGTTGEVAFACLEEGNYQLTLQVPAGYSVIGTSVSPAVESLVGTNGLSFATGSSDQTAVFCIAPIDPWFQTDLGNVRFVSLQNPVPTGKYSSIGENSITPQSSAYPGIYYSSSTNAQFGDGSVSGRNWVVNSEYSYNAETENRNGGMSYDFYKSKARQDGVAITSISTGTFNESEITGSGVYEANGNLTINNYTHVNGRRVVLLVNGNVTINDTSIAIPLNQGLFIVAAKGNVTIASGVGTATLSSTTSNLDGYYTAQGSIVVESASNTCADGTTADRRLNIGGALIANSLKPFSTSGAGTIQNRRSLCIENLNYPSLYVSSRPDFLTQLTDFYKTSYSKWKEVNP